MPGLGPAPPAHAGSCGHPVPPSPFRNLCPVPKRGLRPFSEAFVLKVNNSCCHAVPCCVRPCLALLWAPWHRVRPVGAGAPLGPSLHRVPLGLHGAPLSPHPCHPHCRSHCLSFGAPCTTQASGMPKEGLSQPPRIDTEEMLHPRGPPPGVIWGLPRPHGLGGSCLRAGRDGARSFPYPSPSQPFNFSAVARGESRGGNGESQGGKLGEPGSDGESRGVMGRAGDRAAAQAMPAAC